MRPYMKKRKPRLPCPKSPFKGFRDEMVTSNLAISDDTSHFPQEINHPGVKTCANTSHTTNLSWGEDDPSKNDILWETIDSTHCQL